MAHQVYRMEGHWPAGNINRTIKHQREAVKYFYCGLNEK